MEYLGSLCLLLFCYIIFKEIIYIKERDRMINKLLARSFVEYINCDIASSESKKKPPKKIVKDLPKFSV
jgi:hypothetical protein